MSMNEPATLPAPLSIAEKVVLAQQAFNQFHTRCFWFMREDLQVTEEHLESIIHGLRSHGNREAFLVAAKLCR
jgi:hypothetical protein